MMRMTFWEEVVQANGPRKQKIKAMEELSELIHAIARDLTDEPDPENIAEEMADVFIMLEQLLFIYGNSEAVYRFTRLKEIRMRHRMTRGNADGL